LTYLGILCSEKEEFGESGTYFKKALQLKPDYPLALLSMGNLLFETDHPVNAMKYHLAALKINSKEL
jgi:tetratricopeptide (TPR) repeat protein